MSFGDALLMLRAGRLLRRAGWNGKGMWLYHCTGHRLSFDGSTAPVLPFIVMVTVQGAHVPWLASQTDILADDWEVFS